MFLTYLWQTSGISPAEAYERFSGILNKQRDLYNHAWGHRPVLDIHQQDTILIGQLRYDTGVTGWSPWIDHGDKGLVWDGICETYLGAKFEPTEVEKIQKNLYNKPQDVCNWDGRFCAITWDKNSRKVSLTTGATESPSLWCTEGPQGWAFGSRGSPILEMVGGKKEPSLRDIQLFMVCGYLVGDGSLFENVHRLSSRRQVLFDGVSKPVIRTYASLVDYLQPEQHPTDRNELLQAAADRITYRVGRQLQYSKDPWVLLTGGRDSRCIAAAAKRCGFPGPAHTGGPPESVDVRIASQVADRLKLQWQHDAGSGTTSPMAALVNAMENVKLWIQMSEGLETIRHAVPFQGFFERRLPMPNVRRPLFHGLGGEIGRGVYYNKIQLDKLYNKDSTFARQLYLDRKFKQFNCLTMKHSSLTGNQFQEWLEPIFKQLDDDIKHVASAAQWLDLFFWQIIALQWGEDMMSVKGPMYWHWAPLQDRQLIHTHWHLAPEEKNTSQFWEDTILTISPELNGILYDHLILDTPGLVKRITKKLRSQINKYVTNISLIHTKHMQPILEDTYLLQFWEATLFGKGPHIWTELIDEALLRTIVHKNPRSEILWKTATIELFVNTHF